MGSELNKALAAFQSLIPKVDKRLTADMGTFKSNYAPLEDVTAAAMPLLGEHGLALTMFPTITEDGKFVLAYSLMHASGEHEDGTYPLPERGTPQQIGSALTYARRYILCAVTGVAPGGEDDDGAAAQQEVHMDRARRPQRPPSRPTADPVHTATTGADHERLRHGTVERTPDDHTAARGPLPDEENPWQDVPPEEQPGSADPKDVQKIQIAYGKLGFDHRTDRGQLLNISEQIVGRALTGPNAGRTHNNLSHPEGRKLKDTLEALKGDRGALMERLTGITQAVAATGAQDAAEGSQETGDAGE